MPDLIDEIPWGTAGCGLLAGMAASFCVRWMSTGALSMPVDPVGYFFVLAVGGWGFGVICGAVSSRWSLSAPWILAPVIATGVMGAAVGLLNEAWY
jgi:hypothetical protein